MEGRIQAARIKHLKKEKILKIAEIKNVTMTDMLKSKLRDLLIQHDIETL